MPGVGGLFDDYELDRAGRLIPSQRFNASVTVALAEPHLCVPVNSPPDMAHVLLPDGSAIQIGGEAKPHAGNRTMVADRG